jgi:hypothetical protein
MQKFSTTDAAFAGFRMVREHPKTVAVWGTVLMVLSALTTIIVIAVGGPELQAFFEFDPSNAADAELMAERMLSVLPILLLSGAFNLATSAILLTGVYRMVLRPNDPAPYYLQLGADELRQFCAQVLYTLVVIGAYLGSALLVGAVITILQKLIGDNPLLGLIALLGLVGILGTTIYAAVRFSFAGVMTFVTGRITVMGSLPVTKGRFWPLMGAYLLAFVLFVVVYLAILLLGTAVAMIIGGFAGAGEVLKSDVSSLQAFLTPVGVVRLVLVGALSVLAALVMFAPAPAIYQALNGGAPIDPSRP